MSASENLEFARVFGLMARQMEHYNEIRLAEFGGIDRVLSERERVEYEALLRQARDIAAAQRAAARVMSGLVAYR